MSNYETYLRGRIAHPAALVFVETGPELVTFDEDIYPVERICNIPYTLSRHPFSRLTHSDLAALQAAGYPTVIVKGDESNGLQKNA